MAYLHNSNTQINAIGHLITNLKSLQELCDATTQDHDTITLKSDILHDWPEFKHENQHRQRRTLHSKMNMQSKTVSYSKKKGQ